MRAAVRIKVVPGDNETVTAVIAMKDVVYLTQPPLCKGRPRPYTGEPE